MSQCPRCGAPVDSLQTLDPEVQEQLQKRSGESIPEQICMNCYRELAAGEVPMTGGRRAGSALLAAEKAREQKKLMLWKSRVALIKRARAMMSERAFAEAAVSYEKYLKVIELVYDAKPGELTPEAFKESARTQELTVVASVYWDLMRIYDTSDKYSERQALAAKKLTQFLRFTPIYPDIIGRAESFVKSARNPALFKAFIKNASETKGRCFIATAAFENAHAKEVLVLRSWRDSTLRSSWSGWLFIAIYQKVSPPIAAALDRCPPVKPLVRWFLRQHIRKILGHSDF